MKMKQIHKKSVFLRNHLHKIQMMHPIAIFLFEED